MTDALHQLTDGITTDEWRYAILFGIASIPVSAAIHMQELVAVWYIVLTPVFVAGIAVGYIFSSRPIESRRVGWRAGLIGGVVLLFFSAEFVQLIPDVAAGSAFHLMLFYTLFVVTLVFYILVHGIVGAVGGVLGERIADQLGTSATKTAVE